jgi:hypothetical protein
MIPSGRSRLDSGTSSARDVPPLIARRPSNARDSAADGEDRAVGCTHDVLGRRSEK